MKKLQFETGVKEYELNDGCVVHFNPCDPSFVERVYHVMDKLGKMQNEEPPNKEDGEKVWEEINERDKSMRETINSIFPFDGDVCAKAFPNVGVYALAGGLPLWTNLLLAILDEVEKNLTDEQKKASPRVDYYKKKYGKYLK